MSSENVKPLRCAIYTRKSTEHGLELEFNSLDAQREACEAYIKSQAFQGWRCLPEHYDDPAFSGGNLERPALRKLLRDIDAGRIDIVVVYKIDRLTRSLADFAKLVEAFDARSVSFVAVTQQFNTTSSMGRLTLNVLLSFAQFERELSSERVRDKVAASRAKGKWTGGTVPLGYDIQNKKLIPHPVEAETIRTIFSRYLALRSLQALIDDLDARGIVTKVRQTKVERYRGGIPFTFGSLANLLKNRIYLGEMGHKGKWYTGDHEAILDPGLFNEVQDIMNANAAERKNARSASSAMLLGKLFDDRNNRMSPSYSVKDGVRYRFYVSSALLRGRKNNAGSVSRISATTIESLITEHIRIAHRIQSDDLDCVGSVLRDHIQRIELHRHHIRIVGGNGQDSATVDLPWTPPAKGKHSYQLREDSQEPDPIPVNMVVRAHAWLRLLNNGTFGSVEELAKYVGLHAKNIRQEIRIAFLSPTITEAILTGTQAPAITPDALRSLSALAWGEPP